MADLELGLVFQYGWFSTVPEFYSALRLAVVGWIWVSLCFLVVCWLWGCGWIYWLFDLLALIFSCASGFWLFLWSYLIMTIFIVGCGVWLLDRLYLWFWWLCLRIWLFSIGFQLYWLVLSSLASFRYRQDLNLLGWCWASSVHGFTGYVPIRAGLYLADFGDGYGYILVDAVSELSCLRSFFSTDYGVLRWVQAVGQSVLVAVLRLWGCWVWLSVDWFRWCSLGLRVWLLFDYAFRVRSWLAFGYGDQY